MNILCMFHTNPYLVMVYIKKYESIIFGAPFVHNGPCGSNLRDLFNAKTFFVEERQ